METVNATREAVRKFGITFAVLCAAIAVYLLYKQGPLWPLFAGLSVLFLIGGLAAYPLLRPIYTGWMKFAFVLAWINTRVLLGIFFYLILTPFGLVMRLFGKDLLDQKIDRSATSYWRKKERKEFNPDSYEHLF